MAMTVQQQVPRPFNVYLAPEDMQWLDSMEGVPEVDATPPLVTESLLDRRWQKSLHRSMAWVGDLLPGFVLASTLAWLGTAAAGYLGETLLGFQNSPISGILVTVLLGLAVRNAAGLPAVYERGLHFAIKRVLRLGIALLGLRLSLSAVGEIGFSSLPIVVCCIAVALMLVTWLGRLVGLPARLATLIAVGTGICGASAIVATGPAIDAEEDEISYAVACITLFGMTALMTYPFLGHWLFAADARQIGIFLGTAIHDTSQVAGAALMYQQHYDAPTALDVAATTKLMRNVLMGVVIPLMAVLHHRRMLSQPVHQRRTRLKWSQCIPLFVVVFVALAGLRSLGDLGSRPFGLLDRDSWGATLAVSKGISVGCLTIAMGAVGLGTSFAQLKTLGWKPLGVGLAAALLVGGLSVVLIKVAA
jgi:uncharacterized integral membrane protein (TIGR00698 family)